MRLGGPGSHPRVFSHSNARPVQFKTRLGATARPTLAEENTSVISCSIWTRKEEDEGEEEYGEGTEKSRTTRQIKPEKR